MAVAELVGKSGKIYALDIYPLAIQSVQRIASKKQLTNLETICSDCKTGLPDNGVTANKEINLTGTALCESESMGLRKMCL